MCLHAWPAQALKSRAKCTRPPQVPPGCCTRTSNAGGRSSRASVSSSTEPGPQHALRQNIKTRRQTMVLSSIARSLRPHLRRHHGADLGHPCRSRCPRRELARQAGHAGGAFHARRYHGHRGARVGEPVADHLEASRRRGQQARRGWHRRRSVGGARKPRWLHPAARQRGSCRGACSVQESSVRLHQEPGLDHQRPPLFPTCCWSPRAFPCRTWPSSSST